MSPDTQANLPAILFTGAGDPDACRASAKELRAMGYPVLLACHPQDGVLELAEETGCVYVSAEPGGELRAGLQYFSEKLSDLPGIVSVNLRDGYATGDIVHAADALLDQKNKAIIGARPLSPSVGWVKRMERQFAGFALAVAHSRRITDPWSGLVALPAQAVPAFLGIKGAGRKFSFGIVINLQHKAVRVANVPASAQDRCAEGFWARAWDILRVLFLPLKFVSSSLAAMGTDYAIRFSTYALVFPSNEPAAVAIGRFSGAFINYILNRNVVFRHKGDSWKKELATLTKFATLAVVMYFVSLLLITLFMDVFKISFYLASPLADALLYVPNFLIQRDVVFRRKRTGG